MQDEDARNDFGSFVSPLEPDQRRILNDAITTAAVFVRQFPTARTLDQELREFKANAGADIAAKQVIDASFRSDALLPEHVSILRGELATPPNDRSLNNKARGRAIATTYNVVMKALKIGAACAGLIGIGYTAEIGTEVAKQDALGKKVATFIVDGERVMEQFLSEASADVKTVLREIAKRLKN